MKVKIFVIFCICLTALMLGIGIGSVNIPPFEIIRILSHQLFGLDLPEHISAANVSVVWSIRTPRALLAFVVGAALSTSGAVMQSTLRNPLAS